MTGCPYLVNIVVLQLAHRQAVKPAELAMDVDLPPTMIALFYMQEWYSTLCYNVLYQLGQQLGG